MRICKNIAAIAVLVSAALLVSARGQDKQPERCFLWKASSKSCTVYLLGSMHVAKPELFPLPKEMEDAFAESKKLVVEVNVDAIDQAAMLKLTFEKGLYPAGQTLSKNLSKDTLALLEKYCADKKTLKAAALDPMRPWLVSLLLTVEELKASGYSDEGIDKHFLKKAKAQKKPIVELETAGAQIDLFASMTPELQDKVLAKSLSEAGSLKSTMDKMVAVWKAGDAKAMDETILRAPVDKHPEFKPIMAKMFDERNAKMTAKVEEYLRGNETVFVMVGAGHLVGDKGIVKLLQDKKYKVEQLSARRRNSVIKLPCRESPP